MTRVFPLLLLLAFAAAPAAAQRGTLLGLNVGVAVPSGSMATSRGTGWHLSGTIESPHAGRFRFRADAVYEGFPARLAEDLEIVGARGAVVYEVAAEPRLHALLGAGGYRLRIDGSRNPYGITPGLHAGVGLRIPGGGAYLLVVEAGAAIMLTDYGNQDFIPSTCFPLTIGFRTRR